MMIDFGIIDILSMVLKAQSEVSIAIGVSQHSGGVNGNKRAFYGYFSWPEFDT